VPAFIACSAAEAHVPEAPGETVSTATVFDATRGAFGLPLPALSEKERAQFFLGNSFFNQNWIAAPASVTSRDGLGPLFNARSCSACHFHDGRSRPPDEGEPLYTMLLRLGTGERGAHGEPLPDLTYGGQLQGSSLPGVPKEGDTLLSACAALSPGKPGLRCAF
jgi:CxxC motif-containing protein (DUF1111 family)